MTEPLTAGSVQRRKARRIDLEREVSELRIVNERLRTALKPFAKIWSDAQLNAKWAKYLEGWADRDIHAAETATWGELRAAFNALAQDDSRREGETSEPPSLASTRNNQENPHE